MRRKPDPPHRVLIAGGGVAGLAAAKALRRVRVTVTLVLAEIKGVDLDARTITCGEGLETSYDTLILAGGARAPREVEPDLTLPGRPEVFVLGETAAPHATTQQARHVARTIRRRLRWDIHPRPFRYRAVRFRTSHGSLRARPYNHVILP